MYRVYGLRTLEHMFPNLAVIRGDELILHYAFMLFEMNELTEVILYSNSICNFHLIFIFRTVCAYVLKHVGTCKPNVR